MTKPQLILQHTPVHVITESLQFITTELTHSVTPTSSVKGKGKGKCIYIVPLL